MPIPETCECCGAPMRPLGAWTAACGGCGYQASDLAPAEGTLPGLEPLRRENFETLLDRLERIRPVAGARVLEVGSAWGWFLEAAARRGAIAHGIEPETANAVPARERGLSVEIGFFPQDLRERGPYDLVVFNDVFEHLPRPSSVIRDVEALLAPGGLAVINLPSSRGFLFRVAGLLARLGAEGPLARLWQKGMPSPHLGYFAPANLRLLVERNTSLRAVDGFALRSVSRAGLGERVRASHGGLRGAAMIAAIWTLSFVLRWLPADIEVVVFRRPG